MAGRTIHDPVYGAVDIAEPVLLDLLDSSAMVRLRGIHQGGASYLVRPRRDLTRYDHSIGVMLLIRSLGGSREEQIAGLLHDVSHTAFSHVADLVFQRPDDDYHEQRFAQVVRRSDIPSILARHGVSLDEVCDHHRWPMLEQPSPDLCADRVDYTLRDLSRVGRIAPEDVAAFLGALVVSGGKIVSATLDAAVWFAQRYADEVLELFMNPVELYANALLANVLRAALSSGLINEDDLYARDDEMMERLRASHDAAITQRVGALHAGMVVIEDPLRFDMHARTKPRIADPLVRMADGTLRRCSDLEPSIKEVHRKALTRASEGAFLRLAACDR
jgi:uncharacterized protein